ncbi:Rap1a/Tai family immunity protein [Massilia aquatica]|uniref:Rap1a immunity protein domain-containing protein n=1 Tax=Massilia aquatica TaxID=2609000 RepID=A0ABX0M7M5_9BURK|nr:Rap1a/Tai family immunity protein [Massilia aquatica]NHZ41005.1 hypothetical protein [Massilia aquatica]
MEILQRVSAVVSVLIMVAAHAHAAPPRPYDSHMTGDELVRDMLADPMQGHLNSVRRERAMGYIDGVMGAAAGRQWCPDRKPVPHEMNYLIVEHMSRLGKDKLKEDAAPAVLAVLARLYPCKAAGARR